MCTNYKFVPCYMFVSLLFIFFGSILGMEIDELRRSYCSSPNYTPNSSFSSNLALALSALRTETPVTGFSILTVSASPEAPVTAMALCRGGLNRSLCQACVEGATSGALQACPSKTGAIIWFTYCTIRYSTDNFTNKPDNSMILELYDVRDAPGNVATFDLAVDSFVRDLSAVASEAGERYAAAKSEMPSNMTLYGYLDCTRDIDSDNCQACLSGALQGLHSCCSGKWAGWVGTPSCGVQVNLDPVHDDWKVARDISYYYRTLGQKPESEPEPEPKPDGYRVKRIGVAVGGACALVIIIAIGVMLMCIALRARKRHVDRDTCEEETFLYGLDLLVAATDNFSSSNLLGRGGFGIVYKGKMVDGEEVAVKVLTSDSEQGQEEFMNEIKLLLRTQHRNLVRLLGCCTKGDQKMLVYEYLPNNSLDSFLFDKSKSAILDWTKRYNIIMGIARALLYLHQDCEFRIVHRDIKASNVLLDEDMNPKVSDFGLAKLFTNDDPSKLRTRRIAGTFGYMAPEYAIRGLVSTKGDVFSFGVLLLEIISGRKNFDPQHDDMEMQQLLKHVWRLEMDGRVEEIVDVTIGSYPPQEVMRCIRVGLLCTQKCIQDRPTMAFAMLMLSNTSTTIPVAVSDDTVGLHSAVTSVNSVTLTGPTGR